MFDKIWEFLFRKLLGKLDGYKTYIGVALQGLMILMSAITFLLGLPFLEDVVVLSSIQSVLIEIKMFLETANLEGVAEALMSLGLLDKIKKYFKKD